MSVASLMESVALKGVTYYLAPASFAMEEFQSYVTRLSAFSVEAEKSRFNMNC